MFIFSKIKFSKLSLPSLLFFAAFVAISISNQAHAQLITKTLNVQGVLKSSGGTPLVGTYGMRFNFKKDGVAFTTVCQIVKNSVTVTGGVFNAAVDVSTCNLQNEITAVTAASISVDVEIDLNSVTFGTATASFTGLPMTPVASALVSEKAGNILLSGTSGKVLTHNGTDWVSGAVSLNTAGAVSGILPVANGGTGAANLSGLRTTISAAASGVNSDITSITGLTSALSIAQGGTGQTNASAARAALSSAASGANSDITSLSGLSTALSLTQGGTGAIDANSARANLAAAAAGVNADISSITGLTTALSVSQGGTGGVTAVAARSSLGAAASGANTDITSINGSAATANSNLSLTTGGTATAYTLALAPFTRATGSTVFFYVHAVNTGSASLNVNSSGAATLISEITGAALNAGDLPTGKLLVAAFNGTNWVVKIPALLFTASALTCSTPIAANSNVVCTAITATNSNIGDFVSCSPINGDPATTAGQVSWSALISTANQISIRLGCNNTVSCALTARNWKCLVQK